MKAARDARSILIIEDDVDLARLMQVQLIHEGFTAAVAIGGDQGMLDVEASPPSAVVLDLRMEPTNGFDVLRQLRSGATTAKIPVIVTSVVDEAERRALAEGATAFIVKPYLPRKLADTLRSILD